MATNGRRPRQRAGSKEAIKSTSANLRVALAQIDSEPGDYSANMDKVKQIIDQERGKTDLLVFPEYALSGYLTGQAVYDRALRTDDELFRELIGSTNDIMVAIGFIEETGAFNFYNSMAFLHDREIVAIHRKIYLVNYGVFEERRHFSPGPVHQYIDYGPFRMAPFICSDAWNPALVHLAALDVAHLFVFSALSPTQGLGSRLSTEESWHRMNAFYASMYGVYVLFVNQTGSAGDLDFWGGSQIVDPFGRVIAQANAGGEEVVRAELQLSEVREARTILHTVRDEDLNLLRRRLDSVINTHYSSVEAQNL